MSVQIDYAGVKHTLIDGTDIDAVVSKVESLLKQGGGIFPAELYNRKIYYMAISAGVPFVITEIGVKV